MRDDAVQHSTERTPGTRFSVSARRFRETDKSACDQIRHADHGWEGMLGRCMNITSIFPCQSFLDSLLLPKHTHFHCDQSLS